MFQPITATKNNSGRLAKDVKRHEDNLRFLKSQSDHMDESILDLQVSLGKYYTTVRTVPGDKDDPSFCEETTQQIMKQELTAAALFYQVKTRHPAQLSVMPLTKDVLGVVAALAGVHDPNLNRLLSEYLGLEKMLAVVCKTCDGVKALEKYNGESKIDSTAGLHGLGFSIGRKIRGRFLVICLEDLRPFAGGFVEGDPQKKLAIPKPKLRNGLSPIGFVDFAVNMINIDTRNLSCVTPSGHGLRETLFYALFSGLQVYETRTAMLHALPCITEGALSLDGGMIMKNGIFALGNMNDMEVKFSAVPNCNMIERHSEIEDQIKKLKWEQLKNGEDIRREQSLLNRTKALRFVNH